MSTLRPLAEVHEGVLVQELNELGHVSGIGTGGPALGGSLATDG